MKARATYAIIRRTAYRVDALEQVTRALDEFQDVHAQQPGYAGTIVVDTGGGNWLTVNLWDSQEAASAALPVMVPVVRRLLEPMAHAPSEVIGAGRVILTDLGPR